MKQLIFSITILFFGKILFGHSPDELSYFIQKEGENWQLKVHFTPAAALAVIDQEYPELAKQSVIDLNQYGHTIGKYLQDNITIIINHNPVSLKRADYNLSDHDAIMQFELIGVPPKIDLYMLTINSFNELFRRPMHFVKWQLPDGVHTHLLSPSEPTVKVAISQKLVSQSKGSILYLPWFGLSLMGIVLGTYLWRRNKGIRTVNA